MIFIITILLLAADFYYLKNIAGRRLVGLRWWNEVEPQTGESKWVFESSEPGTKTVNPTDSRFFWLALYVQPLLWVVMAVLALVRLQFLWLPLVRKSFYIPRLRMDPCLLSFFFSVVFRTAFLLEFCSRILHQKFSLFSSKNIFYNLFSNKYIKN